MWWLLRYLSAAASGLGAVWRRLPLHLVVGPVQMGMAQSAKEAGHHARKFLQYAALAFALAYWFDRWEFNIGHELALATHKLGVLWSDFVARNSPEKDILSLFNAPGKPPEKANITGIARLLLVAVLFLLTCGAALIVLVAVLGVARRVYGLVKGARFALWREVAAVQSPGGSAFGHYRGKPLMLHTDKHILIMASTRSGKGVSLIIPHLLRHRGSAFVLDPKGENARATGRQRAALNHQVHYLDPFGISGKPRSRFNPLSRFTPANMEAESKALAAALFATRERDHWTASGQQLVAAFIMYVYASDHFPAETKDLVTVRKLLLGAAPETLLDMKKSKVADGLVASLATSFLNTPDNERGSIISSAQRETEILDNPDIAACLSAAGETPEVEFWAWHDQTMTVYLCLSAPKFPTFNRWLRLVLTSALDEMTDRLDPPPLPICFMLDELATLGHFEPVENAVGLAAGYGVQLYSVFQDVGQMKDLYKGRWTSFIGNAGIRAVFNLDDYDTAHYWSDFLGAQTVEAVSRSQDVFGITTGHNSSETQRPMLQADELMLRYTADKMLVLLQGGRPIEADRVPYFLDPGLAGLWDDPRGPVPAPATVPPAPLQVV